MRSQVIPCEINGGQSGSGQVFLRVLRFSLVNITPPVLSIHLHLHFHLTRETKRQRQGTFQICNAVSEIGQH